MKKKLCFFAKVGNKSELDLVEFYATDLKILKAMDFDIVECTKISELIYADAYFVWWWTWAFIPAFLSILFRKPLFITGTFNCWAYNSRPWYQRKLISFSVNSAKSNIVVSRLEFDQLRVLFPDATIEYSPHVVELDVFQPTEAPRANFLYSTATMTKGNAERKCIPELIVAAAAVKKKFPDFKFFLAGQVDPFYLNFAIEVGAASFVVFLGPVSKAQKIKLLQECLIYAQPSRFEGFGLGILEAQACGAPIVTSKVGAVPEIVGESALFVDGASPSDIARGIIKLIEEPALRNSFSIDGRLRSRSLFSFNRRLDDFKLILNVF